MEHKLVCLGEILMDFLPLPTAGEVAGFTLHPGGGPFNVAVGLARLGHPTAFVGKVGTDYFGRRLRRTVRAEGIDDRWLLDVAAPSTLAFVTVEAGEPGFAFYGEGAADSRLTRDELPAELFAQATMLHFGGISLLRGTTPDTALAAAERLQGRALIACNPNIRPQLVRDGHAYIKLGRKVDILLLDYLDLLMPISKKISAENLFIKDKYVSEELRNLAVEKQCVLVTAAQLNRGAVEEVEFDHSHISGGLSKIQTADNVFGIFTSRAMRERGKYQIQLMKTRSSSGVGMKIDLDFNIDTLRITDPGEEGQSGGDNDSAPVSKGNQILNSLQRTSTTSTDGWARGQPREGHDPLDGLAVKKTTAQVESSKLRQLISNINTDEL